MIPLTLKSLKLLNFGLYKNKKVEFTKGINIIIGENGAGKSTLLRAIRLILTNEPRNAEAIYKNKNTKLPFEIILEDSNNNVYKRKNKKYVINNGKELKAFGQSGSNIPVIINELFPIKDVNINKQLSSHFLILNTGGSAAKQLNVLTNMEDQLFLISQLKERISKCKNKIDNILINLKNNKDTFIKYKKVPLYLIKVSEINIIKSNVKTTEEHIDNLHKTITELVNNSLDLKEYNNLNYYLNEIENIELISKKNLNYKNKIIDLNEVIESFVYLNIDVNKYNIHFEEINSIQKKQKVIIEVDTAIYKLNSLLKEIKDNKEFYEKIKVEYEKLVLKEKETKKICPLCGSVLN